MTGATVSDVLPAGTTFVSATNGATYDAGTNTVHFTTGTLAPRRHHELPVTLAIDAGLDRHPEQHGDGHAAQPA